MRHLYLLVLFIFLSSCTNSKIYESTSLKIDLLNDKYAPDARVAVWNIDVNDKKIPIELVGETNLNDAKNELIEYLKSEDISFEDNIILLPNHDFKYGIINNSVANLRKNPSHSSELVSQTILGTGVSILKKEGEWYLIQTPDKYISWIDHGGIVPMSKEKYNNYFASDVGVFTRPYGFSYETKKKNRVVSDLVLGSVLKIVEVGSKHTKYKYPDGRIAWIENGLMNSISSIRGMNYSIQNLLENAHSLIGVPYLWGGTSSKGFDCSGYTKSVYLMNGYILPRDASQQIKEGILVDDSRNWNLLETGDLMFFGYYKDDKLRIDHVSIWLGDGYFIQSSKNVRISSVYSDNSNFDDYHMAKYIESRRIIGSNTEGIKKL
jgi:hypothetical protein